MLDDEQEWPSFSKATDATGQVWESNLIFEGMHCAACAISIEDAVKKVPGVLSAEVSAASHRGRVVWSAQQVKPSQWAQAVAEVGYTTLPANDASLRARRLAQSRRELWRWLVAGLCMMQVMMYATPAYVALPGEMTAEMASLLRWASWVLTLPVILFSCGPFFTAAWRDLRQRSISMDLPVALGMGITFVVSTMGTFEPAGIFGREVYFDSLTMFVFFLLTGRWLEARLRDRTAGALEALSNRLPDSVERQSADGSYQRVAVRRLVVGDVVRVLPGESFPADGTVISGDTMADEALLTGESHPLPKQVGSGVIAGSHNLAAAILMRVERLGNQTRFAQIVALMETAAVEKPQLALLADRMAKPFLVAVLLAAGAAGAFWWARDPAHAVMVAVAVLIVTCPCALSLATPTAMLAAAGAMARRGILVRRLQAIEAMAQVDTLVFDKTGTLTSDTLEVKSVQVRDGRDQSELISLAGALAQHSLHPASRAVSAFAQTRAASGQSDWTGRISDVREVAGQGMSALVHWHAGESAHEVRLGSAGFGGVQLPGSDTMMVVLSDAHGVLASFELGEQLRDDARAAVAALQRAGVDVQLLSGDVPAAAARIAAATGIEKFRGGCTPQDKLLALQQAQKSGHHVAMVGDGLNDGPVLAGAHVSFALGRAVPLAQAQADFIVMSERLLDVARALLLSRRTLRVVKQNLLWAAVYNAICVPAAVLGWLPAWLAGLGMAISSVLVVLNALRLSVGFEMEGGH